MNKFSGRRPNDRAKRIGKGFLEGLSMLGTVLADGPKIDRIREIDGLIVDLKQERDSLVAGLVEPGDYKVSDDFDPHWRKSEPEPLMDTYFGKPGRLTKCEGRTSLSRYHSAHPGCPYVEQIHNAHEFTLRD